jgi:predicted solute-binding protein
MLVFESDGFKLRVGAVRYLNMLPYFCGNEEIVLFESPRELNNAMREERLDAACMSLIAGKNLQLRLLPFGIYGTSKVMSVLLFPLNAKSNAIFDPRFEVNNFHSAKCVILTSGASEQSVFMAEALLRKTFNFAEIGVSTQPNLTSKSLSQISHEVENDSLCMYFYLSIGDEAIFRHLSEKPSLFWDIATEWNRVFHENAQFAGWFVQNNVNAKVLKILEKSLEVSINTWNAYSELDKLNLAQKHISQSSLLSFLPKSEVSLFLSEYFSVLKYYGGV